MWNPPKTAQLLRTPRSWVFCCLLCLGACIAQAGASNATLETLTNEERAWLREHPVIRVVQDPNWPPIEFADDQGNPAGIANDYLKLVEQHLGVRFEVVRAASWQEAYARLKKWDVDMTTSVAATAEREQFWAFTKPYINIPIVILTRTDVLFIPRMKELSGKKVAVVEGYFISERLAKDFPGIRLVKVRNVREGISLLQKGEVFAFIDNMLSINYCRAKFKINGLRTSGETPYINAQCMAVRKDWAILAGMIQKVIDSLTDEEHSRIYGKWVPSRYDYGFNYSLFWKFLGVFVLLLSGMGAWNRKLSREIAHRKAVEAALRETETRYRLLFEHSPDGIIVIDMEDARLIEFNEAAYKQLGYTREEFSRLTLSDLEVSKPPKAGAERTGKMKCGVRDDYQALYRTRSGEARNMHVTAQMTNILGRAVCLCVCRDITERTRAEEALRQSEALLRIAGRTARLGGWSMDLAGNRVIWSDEVALIHDMPVGYSPLLEEGLNFYAPEWREKIKAVFNACAREGVPYDEEMEITTARGRRIWVRAIGEAVRDDTGKIIKVQGAFQDITEVKELNEQNARHLRELEVFYKASIGREERILELKKELERLMKELGK